MIKIHNLSLVKPTSEQVADGLCDLLTYNAEQAYQRDMLTFKSAPSKEDLMERSELLTSLMVSAGITSVMVSTTMYFLPVLVNDLQEAGIKVYASYGRRSSTGYMHESWVDLSDNPLSAYFNTSMIQDVAAFETGVQRCAYEVSGNFKCSQDQWKYFLAKRSNSWFGAFPDLTVENVLNGLQESQVSEYTAAILIAWIEVLDLHLLVNKEDAFSRVMDAVCSRRSDAMLEATKAYVSFTTAFRGAVKKIGGDKK